MFVLDTNVVSELRKATTGKADANVIAWAASVPAGGLYVAAVTILELELGILQVERRDPRQGGLLRAWMDNQVMPAFSGRVLAFDTPVARRCARLHVPDPRSDRDAMIAATALEHGMTVVTRNTDDFKGTGVKLLDPWLPRDGEQSGEESASAQRGSAGRSRRRTPARRSSGRKKR